MNWEINFLETIDSFFLEQLASETTRKEAILWVMHRTHFTESLHDSDYSTEFQERELHKKRGNWSKMNK